MTEEITLAPGTQLHGFTVVRTEDVPEVDGRAVELRHDLSGAKLLYLANDDANKAFSISFKTPPTDDTGVFHILEHSVLCGSAKFPVKEPFVNLLKSSMQTFLNAMTFPDKTMYPVASTNEQDLLNLMDVYLDAVLHPNIYAKEAIFSQEGWHYEVDEDGQLTYNGVVFNEMKGALSDSDSVAYNAICANLFPDNAYRYESGGIPEAIPELTYQQFLDTHSRHYKLDNSMIMLYGDLDINRFLEFLDTAYLTPDANLHADAGQPAELKLQAPVKNLGVKKTMATAPENSVASVAYVVGESTDSVRIQAADILLDALMGSNEAPLKRALLDAGLASDVGSYLADGMLQPFCMVTLRGLKEGAADQLIPTLTAAVEKILADGLDHELIEAALSHMEFVMRERNFGIADGVAFAMASAAGWLYDDAGALTYIKYEEVYAFLRQALKGDYFEDLCRSLFLENDHMASVEVIPVEEEGESPEAQRLAKIAADMDDAQLDALRSSVEELRAAQEAPDAPEDLAKLPHLGVADIAPAPEVAPFGLDDAGAVPVIRHTLSSHGIVYVDRYYGLECVSFDELPYVSLLAGVLGKLDTTVHTAAQIDTLCQANLGNLSCFTEVHTRMIPGDLEDPATGEQIAVPSAAGAGELAKDVDPAVYGEGIAASGAAAGSGAAANGAAATNEPILFPKLVFGGSALPAHMDSLVSIPAEIALSTQFVDQDGHALPGAASKVKDLLTQRKVALEQNFINNGHSAAMARVNSYFSRAAALRGQTGSVNMYRFLTELLEHFDERVDDLMATFENLCQRIFRSDNCTMAFTGPEECLAEYRSYAADSLDAPAAGQMEHLLQVPDPEPLTEAFVVPTGVTFSAVGYNRKKLVKRYSGVWLLASRALSCDYLWNEVRVKGGSYGTGFKTMRGGQSNFYSYRDPHLDETLDRYQEAGAWLRNFAPSQDEFEGYVVSTVSSMDAPLRPHAASRVQDGWFFAGYNPAERQMVRQQVIDATPEQLRALGSAVEQLAGEGYRCVFGNGDIIRSSKRQWHVVELLGGKSSQPEE